MSSIEKQTAHDILLDAVRKIAELAVRQRFSGERVSEDMELRVADYSYVEHTFRVVFRCRVCGSVELGEVTVSLAAGVRSVIRVSVTLGDLTESIHDYLLGWL